MNVYELCGDRGLFGRFARRPNPVQCSIWTSSTQLGGPNCIVKAYRKTTRQESLERSIDLAGLYLEKRLRLHGGKASESANQAPAEKGRQPLSIEEAERNTAQMILSFSSNREMRELLESASLFAGADNIGGARCMRRSRLQITKHEP